MRRAFTLIELLVVITIIAILTSMLLVVIGLVRESARGTVCQGNLRQISLVAFLYGNDNEGVLPFQNNINGNPSEWWGAWQFWVADNTLREEGSSLNMYWCPKSFIAKPKADDVWRNMMSSYAQNEGIWSRYGGPLSGGFGGVGDQLTLARIPRHSATMLYGEAIAVVSWQPWDGGFAGCSVVIPTQVIYDRAQLPGFYQAFFPRATHRKRMNGVFYDGHTASIDASQTGPQTAWQGRD